MLKLYVQNNGVYGMVVAVAITEEQAKIAMKTEFPEGYEEGKPLFVYPLISGLVVGNSGDR